MDELISIIIPVFRTEATLDSCIKSVASQAGEDCEIVLVDDGSPDDCPAMCDAWTASDSRIRVLHKPNGGLSSARNAGIAVARGSRLMFVDSDDYIKEGTIDAIKTVVAEHPEYDIIEFPLQRLHGRCVESTLMFENRAYTDTNEYWFGCRAYAHCYACNKVFRRSLFDGITFPDGIVFEDVYVMPLLLRRAKTIATMSRGLYCYMWNADGITATADAAAQRMLLSAHLRFISDADMSVEGADEYYMHVVNIQIVDCEKSGERPLLPSRRVSMRAVGKHYRLKALLLNVFGLSTLCHIIVVLRRLLGRK